MSFWFLAPDEKKEKVFLLGASREIINLYLGI